MNKILIFDFENFSPGLKDTDPLLCGNKFVLFFSSWSSFLHIMRTHNEFCKTEVRFMLLIIFHYNPVVWLIMKMTTKQFLFLKLKTK